MRIVSLLPSTTEILYAIGAGADVVGVTFECDYPEQARTATIVSTSALPAGLSPTCSTRSTPGCGDRSWGARGLVGRVAAGSAGGRGRTRRRRWPEPAAGGGAGTDPPFTPGHWVLPTTAEVLAVDANASWARPGPRLVDGIEELAAVLYPG